MKTNRGEIFLLIVIMALLFGSCSHRPPTATIEPDTFSGKGFVPPDIPNTHQSTSERNRYLIVHYWDRFNFDDTTLISNPDVTEQAFVDFINLLPYVSIPDAQYGLRQLIHKASTDAKMLNYFIALTEKYFYDPNSPFRQDEYYRCVVQYIIDSTNVDKQYKIRPQYQLSMINKNRVGDVATDFVYTLGNGQKARMRAIKADYTILFFNNPDCPECARIKEAMRRSPIIAVDEPDSPKIKVSVLGMYVDNNINLWYKAVYPSFMLNAYDAGQILTKKNLYDLRAIPTLYLLDENKRVILKDATFDMIEQWFINQ